MQYPISPSVHGAVSLTEPHKCSSGIVLPQQDPLTPGPSLQFLAPQNSPHALAQHLFIRLGWWIPLYGVHVSPREKEEWMR